MLPDIAQYCKHNVVGMRRDLWQQLTNKLDTFELASQTGRNDCGVQRPLHRPAEVYLNIYRVHRRTQEFTMKGVHVLGAGRGPAVGSRGKAPVWNLGDEVSQKLKKNVKLVYNI